MNRRAIGAAFEDRAADWLRARNFTIVTRRWTGTRGEIDVIAMEGEELVFVEVRARLTGDSPELSLTPSKVAHLAAAAFEYRTAVDWGDRPYRWDVIAFDSDGMRHHRNAFVE